MLPKEFGSYLVETFAFTSINGMVSIGSSEDATISRRITFGLETFRSRGHPFFCISQAACTKKDAAHGHELNESMIIQSNCGENCNETHLLFYAEAVDDSESIVGAELSVSPSEASGFSYCLSYFNDRTCAESQLTWSRAMGGHLTFPCGDPNIGYLIEALRVGNVGGEAHDLPSIWLAYANGEVAAAEGETPEALLPLFVCSGE